VGWGEFAFFTSKAQNLFSTIIASGMLIGAKVTNGASQRNLIGEDIAKFKIVVYLVLILCQIIK
jgi:hypothetical protein